MFNGSITIRIATREEADLPLSILRLFGADERTAMDSLDLGTVIETARNRRPEDEATIRMVARRLRLATATCEVCGSHGRHGDLGFQGEHILCDVCVSGP